MKKIILLAMACTAVVAPKAIHAIEPFIDGYYAGIQGGLNFGDINNEKRIKDANIDTGYIISGSLGYRTCYNVRVEGEISHRSNNLHGKSPVSSAGTSEVSFEHKGGYVSTTSFMANALYDFPTCYFVKPYAGLGVGYSRNKINTSNSVKGSREKYVGRPIHKNQFAWQAIAGIAYPLEMLTAYGYNVDATLEYRYFKPSINGFRDHSLLAGLKTNF